MMPDVKNSNAGRQEFIDLLCRITKPDEETMVNEPEIVIIEDQAAEDGEITIDDDDEEGKEMEDGEITESQGSDVCICFFVESFYYVIFNGRMMMWKS